MSSKDVFTPYSPQLGVAGSSYRLQLGQVSGKWAVRLAKGQDVLDSFVFEHLTDINKLPNADDITRWVLSTLVIPNINPHQIMKTVGFVRQQAKRQIEEKKRQPEITETAKDVKLEKAPEDAQITRPKSLGTVKQDPESTGSGSEALEASNQQGSVVEDKRGRKLKTIPKGAPPAGEAKAAASAGSSNQGSGGSTSQGIPCGGCGTKVVYCPCCGKPLK